MTAAQEASKDAQPDFRVSRRGSLVAISVSMALAAMLWTYLAFFTPPAAGLDTLAARMLLTLKWSCVAALFCLAMGVEAIAHERLLSPAFDPLAGFETRRLRVNLRYLQNTLEQFALFVPALFGVAAFADDAAAMRVVPACAVVWIVFRLAFWIGYHHSAAMRAAGAPSMALTLLMLLYVVARFGFDFAGIAGAAAPILAFAGFEAFLFRVTMRPD